jgi:isoleucyl-tRNA synthetase
MSKSKRNFTDPMILVDKYGVDSLRLYFASSPIMKTAENVNFSEKHVDEIRKKVFNIFWNVCSFYTLYDDGNQNFKLPIEPNHVLDKWLVTRLVSLDRTVTQAMDAYDVVSASRALIEFVDEFSTWWLRMSRDRLKEKSINSQPLQVFRAALLHWSLLMAPIAPFFTELVYQTLVQDGLDSIHLEKFSADTFTGVTTHQDLEVQTKEVRKAIEKIHSARKASGLKLRQPLRSVVVTSTLSQPDSELLQVMAAEVNVKQIIWQAGEQLEIELDTKITEELLREGQAREIIRQIQGVRKKMGLKVEDHIKVILPQWPEEHESLIKEKVGAVSLSQGQDFEIRPT